MVIDLTLSFVRRTALFLAAAALLSGCGYHLVGTTSFLPEELERLHLGKFENMTSWPDVDQRLDEALAREWVRRRRFDIPGSFLIENWAPGATERLGIDGHTVREKRSVGLKRYRIHGLPR